MLTKRLTGLTVAAALCGGCGTLADQRTGSVNSAPQPRPAISVGQPFDEAKNLLAEAGAEDITHAVGVISYGPGELRWFHLRDGKRLSVRVIEVGEPRQLVVDNLVLVRGDFNKKRTKEREITRLELP